MQVEVRKREANVHSGGADALAKKAAVLLALLLLVKEVLESNFS